MNVRDDLLVRLLEATSWRALDVDDEGRILAGHDALTEHADRGTVQLVELRPGSGEDVRVPLTALPGACHGRYVPGRRTIVVSHDTGGDERAQLSLLDAAAVSAPVGEDGLIPLLRDPDHLHVLVEVLPGPRLVYTTNRRNGVDFDVLVRDLDTGAEHVLYDGGGLVESVAVSPDGRRAALTRPARAAMSSQLLAVDPDGGLVELTDPDEPAQHAAPQWFPDSTSVLVRTDSGRDRTGLARVDVTTGERTWLVVDDDHDVAGRLAPDGSAILVATDEDGASRLTVHDADGGGVRHAVSVPGVGVGAHLTVPRWSPDSTGLALTWTDPATPGDVLLVDARTGRSGVVASSRVGDAEGIDVVTPTSHAVPAPDGESVPCFVYAPAQPQGSSVTIVHGGPEGQSVRAFSPIVQALVGEGHTVLVPNVRGSVGYGKRWYSLDDVERRLDSVADLAALHDWLPTLGLDPARAALWGASYGGYMVLAGLAFQPQRWAAGVDIVGISSLVTFLENTSAYRRAHREREYGSLAHHRAFLESASPLNRIGEVRAPLFVIHGANDPRVPLSEAEQVAAAVRANGVDCELVVYDDEGHGLAKRANRLDAYPRAVAFLRGALAR